LFRKHLSEAGVIDELFERFEQYLQTAGYVAKGGQIIDAALIPVPVQRNSRKENTQIKNGEVLAEWEENLHKRVQKDVDARWTKRNGKSYFGIFL